MAFRTICNELQDTASTTQRQQEQQGQDSGDEGWLASCAAHELRQGQAKLQTSERILGEEARQKEELPKEIVKQMCKFHCKLLAKQRQCFKFTARLLERAHLSWLAATLRFC